MMMYKFRSAEITCDNIIRTRMMNITMSVTKCIAKKNLMWLNIHDSTYLILTNLEETILTVCILIFFT